MARPSAIAEPTSSSSVRGCYVGCGSGWTRRRISSRDAGLSIVDGTSGSAPSAICRSNRRMILPERVFGRAGTMSTAASDAIGPTRARTSWLTPLISSDADMSTHNAPCARSFLLGRTPAAPPQWDERAGSACLGAAAVQFTGVTDAAGAQGEKVRIQRNLDAVVVGPMGIVAPGISC